MPRRIAEISAAFYVPEDRSLAALKEAASHCQGCPLWERGTQTVFGEGSPEAEVVLVGEQPGDREDLEGRPFVGPAGALLDHALAEAGINRSNCYVTNAVKHFKWELRGKRRIHKKPNSLEIRACRPWIEAELQAVHPKVVVCLGATAAQSLLGPTFRVTQRRGEVITDQAGRLLMATVHPSSILRSPDEQTRREEMKKFVADLKQAARVLHEQKRAA